MTERYSLHLRLIHWITVALVAAQVTLALLNMALYEPRPVLADALVQAHISVGSVVFALTMARLVSRWLSPKPAKSGRPWLQLLATLNHALLYACLLALPVTGYLKLAALGFTVTPFGLFPLPPLPLDVSLAQGAERAHDAIALLLGALLSLHIAAAFLHRHLDGQDVLPRILLRMHGR